VLALQLNPTLALARRLLGRAPEPRTENESVVQARTRPDRPVSDVVRVQAEDPLRQKSPKAQVKIATLPLPSPPIAKEIVLEPGLTIGRPPTQTEPKLPYSLSPELQRLLQEKTPNILESGRSVLIDGTAEPPYFSRDEVQVATGDGSALLIPVVLADLEASLAADPAQPIELGSASPPNPPINLARLFEDSEQLVGTPTLPGRFDSYAGPGLSGLFDFPDPLLDIERHPIKTAALLDLTNIIPEEDGVWNLALMVILMGCAAVPTGRRKRSLPRRQRPRKRASATATGPSGGDSCRAALAETEESWDLAAPSCLFPVAEFPSLASPGTQPVSASCGPRFQEASKPDEPLSTLARHSSEVEVDELGRVVKPAVGALVLTQLATPLIRHYQRQG